MTTTTNISRSRLRTGSALRALALTGAGLMIGFAAPAFAQDQAAATPDQAAPDQAAPAQTPPNTPVQTSPSSGAQAAADTSEQGQDIVVTGTLFRTNNAPSPITQITAEDLDRRGVSTTQDAIQMLAANNGPALTNSFSANGAFAGGASAVSLRGLTTNSTLVLFDGLRAADYPLADDGTRNFVDLNTIPDDIVDHIEVLRDGASASYGADAIAGVVNIITKREIKGVMGRAEGGISEKGDGGQYRLSLTAGVGDLDDQGYNAYLSGFYYRQNILYNRDRQYPYNSDDLRGICHNGTCGSDNRVNGLNADGSLASWGTVSQSFGELAVRPYDATNTTPIAGSTYVNLQSNCLDGTRYDLTAADHANLPVAPNFVCQVDRTNEYGVISPEVERWGISGRVTAKIGSDIEAHAEVNFIQSTVSYTGTPASIWANAPAPFYYPRYSTRANTSATGGTTILTLPVYVCPERVNCATAADRTLNPNNPFAPQGYVARLVGIPDSTPTYTRTRNRAYRGALGIKGPINDFLDFNVEATVMHDDLNQLQRGYVYIQHLLDVIADGSYNFKNPSANTQATLNYLHPDDVGNATSDEVQVQGTITARLATLPGGPLQLGVGVSERYEAVDAPSINSDFNGPTERYFTLNGFATKGHRYVFSTYAELNAPILDQITVNLSGRYDKYSTGPDNFSPKAGVVFNPVHWLTLRGTYSRGFRIPSFGEANATFPTTGYVTASKGIYPDSYLAQYGCSQATYTTKCPSYLTQASYGLTDLPNAKLKPEKSRSFTGGIELRPIPGVSLTADYYNIKKTGAITTPDFAPALAAYYSGQPIPAAYTVIPDAADIDHANATPRIAFIQAGFINANTIKTSGLDFGIDGTHNFGFVRFSSHLDATYILRLETTFPDGHTERYDGTLGNFNLTAGSGTPKWHGTWLNTFDFGNFLLSGTVNYFGGYNLSAMDQGTGYKDCGLDDGTVPCNVKSYITFDLNGTIRVNDKFSFYMNVMNLFNRYPPLDPVTYGAHLYNPVQGGDGIYGRYFKAGVKFGF